MIGPVDAVNAHDVHAAIPTQAQTTVVFGPETFTRDKGKPQTVSKTFAVEDPAGEFTLLVQNGVSESSQTSSAVIELNGELIAGPNDFNQQVIAFDKPVSLGQQNLITVEIRGAPGSSIVVSILKGSAASIFPKLTLFTNRNDPELLRSETPNGEVIDYFGTKDDQGIATALKVVRVQPADGGTTTVFLDDRARPRLMEAPNGLVFEIIWQTDTSIIVRATTEDALFHVDVPFDFTTNTAGHATISSNSSESSDINALKSFSLASFRQPAAQSAAATVTSPSVSIVTVRQCGAPIDNADVSITATTANRPPITGYGNLITTGSGRYSVNLPTFDRNANLAREQKCRSTLRNIGFACNIFNFFAPALHATCIAVAALLALDIVTAPLAILVLEGCPSLVATLQLACTLGYNGPVLTPLSHSDPFVTNFFCGYLLRKFGGFLDRATTTPIDLAATVKIPGTAGAISQFYQGAPPFGPFPSFNFDFPCQRQQCVPGFGGQYFSDGRDVKVTILPFEADFTDEIRLIYPVNRTIGTNRDVGRVVDLGSFRFGTELIFAIYVVDTGQTFRIGPSSRNPDRIVHARVECLGDGKAKVFFEDNLGGGDRDFDDAVLQITSAP